MCVCVWRWKHSNSVTISALTVTNMKSNPIFTNNLIWGQSVISLQLKSGSGWRLHIGSWRCCEEKGVIVQGSGKMRFRCIKRVHGPPENNANRTNSFSNQTKMKRALGNIHWVPPPHQTSLCLKSVKVCYNMFWPRRCISYVNRDYLEMSNLKDLACTN